MIEKNRDVKRTNGKPCGIVCRVVTLIALATPHGRIVVSKDVVVVDIPALPFRWYRKSVEEGDPRGAYFTAKYHSLGRGGAKKSAAQAVRWWRWGAEMGDPPCMHQLSGCLYDGLGTAPNTSEAEKWMREGAGRQDVRAMYSLGWRLYHGRRVISDPKAAVGWWRKASLSHQTGHDLAIYGLGRAHSDGRGVPRDPSGALNFFRIAARLGNEHAMYRLGCAFRDGEGVERDPQRALVWYRRVEAASSGLERRPVQGPLKPTPHLWTCLARAS